MERNRIKGIHSTRLKDIALESLIKAIQETQKKSNDSINEFSSSIYKKIQELLLYVDNNKYDDASIKGRIDEVKDVLDKQIKEVKDLIKKRDLKVKEDEATIAKLRKHIDQRIEEIKSQKPKTNTIIQEVDNSSLESEIKKQQERQRVITEFLKVYRSEQEKTNKDHAETIHELTESLEKLKGKRSYKDETARKEIESLKEVINKVATMAPGGPRPTFGYLEKNYNTKKDLSSTDTGKGASLIGIEDLNNLFTSDNVEGALVEAYNAGYSAHVHTTGDITDYTQTTSTAQLTDYLATTSTSQITDYLATTSTSQLTDYLATTSTSQLTDINTNQYSLTGHTHSTGSLTDYVQTTSTGQLTDYLQTTSTSQLTDINTSQYALSSHTHNAVQVTGGTFADAVISESSVTQHQGAIDHGSIAGLSDNDHPQYSLTGHSHVASAIFGDRVSAIPFYGSNTALTTSTALSWNDASDSLLLGLTALPWPTRFYVNDGYGGTQNAYAGFVGGVFTPTSNTTASYASLGFVSQTSGSFATSGQVRGVDGVVFHAGTSFLGSMLAANYVVKKDSTGPLTSGYGINMSIQNNSAGVLENAIGAQFSPPSSGGPVTNNFGMFVLNQGGAQVTNAAGIVIFDITGASGLNQAIYAIGGRVSFNLGQTTAGDFEVYGQNDTNLFYIDVSTDSIGMGTSTPNSKLHVAGNMAVQVTAVSTDFTASTDFIYLVDASVSAVNATLPSSYAIGGREYTIKKTDSTGNLVTIDGLSAETIDGSTTKTIGTQYDSFTVVAHNSAWHII